MNSIYIREKSLREFICDLLNKYCGHYLSASDFEIHHKNGNHSQSSVNNVVLLPTYKNGSRISNNSSLHNKQRRGLIDFNSNDENYIQLLLYMDAIDVEKSLDSGKIVNVNGEDIWDRLNKR